MAISIGTDIEEVSRFTNKVKDELFLNKVYTPAEVAYCNSKSSPAQHLAVRWCAKEAVVKALAGFDISDVTYKEIEIFKNENGVPQVKIEKYPELKTTLSLSHTKTYALAQVLIQK
jgi:phosphopantetheine--protein transferase-like protein